MPEDRTDPDLAPRALPRRRFLQLGGGLALAGTAAACTQQGGSGGGNTVGPRSQAVQQYAAAEQRRFPNGRTVSKTVTAAPEQVDIGGKLTTGWVYNGQLPGPMLRANVGDRVRVRIDNRLPESTTVHWHGLAIRNDMDGVPKVTQQSIAAGAQFDYGFIPPDPGTYWYHSHGDLQRGRGLYGALLIDDPRDAGDYDVEFTVVLADWLIDRTPKQVFAELRSGGMANMGGMHGGMGNMHGGGKRSSKDGGGDEMTSRALKGDAGDVRYPVYLLNGKPPNDAPTFTAQPGQRARIRVINAAEDTTFRVALGGHRLTVTHSDGRPVEPVDGDAVLIGMGERYDVVTTLADGAFPLVARAEGKGAQAFAVVRTGSGAAPATTAMPSELHGKLLTLADLRAAEQDRLPRQAPQRTLNAKLGGSMSDYHWTINGKTYPKHTPLAVRRGERVRLVYTNQTMMYHPMHLHGHTFALARNDGAGPRKDTVIVLPGQSIAADFDTDNPGQWFTHCHNEYHLAAGMATVVSYQD